MKKYIKSSMNGNYSKGDYEVLRPWIKQFLYEAKNTLLDMADEDNEVSEDELVELTSQYLTEYLEDIDIKSVIRLYIELNFRDINKYLESRTSK